MASRAVFRSVSRRFSSGGKMFSEEEKAAENVYIKKIEQEKLEKLARKGPKPEETTSATVSAATAEVKQAGPTVSSSATQNVSTDKNRNYAVVVGVMTVCAALGWYIKGSEKKPEIQED